MKSLDYICFVRTKLQIVSMIIAFNLFLHYKHPNAVMIIIYVNRGLKINLCLILLVSFDHEESQGQGGGATDSHLTVDQHLRKVDSLIQTMITLALGLAMASCRYSAAGPK